jgi:diadenosine tetraphosphate (Ap4A) HIT family hydrolase
MPDRMETTSIFTQMVRGERHARFVWNDGTVVAMLSATPLNPGHTLVLPIREVDDWVDLEPALLEQLMHVAQQVAAALRVAFRPVKVGVMIAGIEVRHVHVHLVPIDAVRELSFDRQDAAPDPAALDDAAERIRSALRDLGHTHSIAAHQTSTGDP